MGDNEQGSEIGRLLGQRHQANGSRAKGGMMAGTEVSFHSFHQQMYIHHTVVESEIAGEGFLVGFGSFGVSCFVFLRGRLFLYQ